MDAIKINPSYPQKVEVVGKVNTNFSTDSPFPISFPESVLQHVSEGNDLLKTAVGNSNTWVFAKPSSGYYNVHVDALYIVEPTSGLTQIVPLGSCYYNLSTTQITAMENGFHNFNILYPATTRAYVIYSKVGNDMQAEQIVYSLQ